MASAGVEALRNGEKKRAKTKVFWSTVPEDEQFRNVRVPGVAAEVMRASKINLKHQPQPHIVKRSKSDSAVSSKHDDLLTFEKDAKADGKKAQSERKFVRKSADVLKRDLSSSQADSMASFAGGDSSRRAAIKTLNVEDKRRVANLIKELAKTGEERELALERLQEERVSFEERLRAIQEEQVSLRLERESLQQKLEKGKEQLKKYEAELNAMKMEKEKQDKIFQMQRIALTQSTQTSPLIKTSHDLLKKAEETSKSADSPVPYNGERKRTKSTNSTNYDPSGTLNDPKYSLEIPLSSGHPEVPVYSNSLFDLKVTKVEESNDQHNDVLDVSGDHHVLGVGDGTSLHELYLREYKLQLRLQEQQLEIQRQQVLLQQHLQLLQQQQQQQPKFQQAQQQHQLQQVQNQQHHQEQKQQQTSQQQIHAQQQDLAPGEEQVLHTHYRPFQSQLSQQNPPHPVTANPKYSPRSDKIQNDLEYNPHQKQPQTRFSNARHATDRLPPDSHHLQQGPEQDKHVQPEWGDETLERKPRYSPGHHHDAELHRKSQEEHIFEKSEESTKQQNHSTDQDRQRKYEQHQVMANHRYSSPQHRYPWEKNSTRTKDHYDNGYHHHSLRHTYPSETRNLQFVQPHSYTEQHGYSSKWCGPASNQNGTSSIDPPRRHHHLRTDHHSTDPHRVDFVNSHYQSMKPKDLYSDQNVSKSHHLTEKHHYSKAVHHRPAGCYYVNSRNGYVESCNHVTNLRKPLPQEYCHQCSGELQDFSEQPCDSDDLPGQFTKDYHPPRERYSSSGIRYFEENSHHGKLHHSPTERYSPLGDHDAERKYHPGVKKHHSLHYQESYNPHSDQHKFTKGPSTKLQAPYASGKGHNSYHPFVSESNTHITHHAGHLESNSLNTSDTPRKTKHQHPNSDRKTGQPQVNEKYAAPLDEYISNHQNSYNFEQMPSSRKTNVGEDPFRENLWHEKLYPVGGNHQDNGPSEDEPFRPGYSLYKPEMPLTTTTRPQSPNRSKRLPIRAGTCSPRLQSSSHRYPDSLAEIVDHLESEYDETLSDDRPASEVLSPNTDEEETSILDDIFFLKR